MSDRPAWKTTTILVGGAAGLLIGLLAAFLFVRNRPDDQPPKKLSSKQGMQLGMGLVSFIKQLIEIGK
jgi:hypothetical protein